MENYEEKFKQRLEKAKKYMSYHNDGIKECLIDIFPELAESEDEMIRKRLIEWVEEIRKCNPSNAEHNGECSEAIAWIEKQGEQKSIKEKVWTIYDAKDGDVLNSVRVQATIIFKGFADDGKHIIAYCGLQKGKFIAQEMLWDRDFEPASEYWKNALYKAMTEKDYEWDFDNFKLNKIEQKPIEFKHADTKSLSVFNNHKQSIINHLMNIYRETDDKSVERNILKDIEFIETWKSNAEWSDDDEKIMLTIISDGVRKVGLDEGQIQWLKALKNRCLPQPKQEWSEEDETALQDALWCIEQARKKAKDENDMGTCWFAEKWLKSLKDRVRPQLKQEWGEEDEETRKMLCNYFEDKKARCIEMQDYVPVKKYPFTEAKMYETALRWLKSIKDKVIQQSHWKPSDEQLKALKLASDKDWDIDGNSPLYTLYNDLKKL